MDDFLKAFEKTVTRKDRPSFRDWRAHSASDSGTCLRDLYWKATGVEKTNPPDMVSCLKMAYGSAIGSYFQNYVFSRMFRQGYVLEAAEVKAGGSDPDINCYWDCLFSHVDENGEKQYFIEELKTASGYGAKLLAESFEPKENYLVQLGIYLKNAHKKGLTVKGNLFYFLLNDRHVGSVVRINCYYDPKTDEIVAYKGTRTSNGTVLGDTKVLTQRVSLAAAEEKLRKLDKYIADEVVPPGDYQYKYPVTPESVAQWSDSVLLKAVKGIVHGDWQVKYSGYKDLQLETDGVSPGYTDEEMRIIKAEKRKRTPNSKYV